VAHKNCTPQLHGMLPLLTLTGVGALAAMLSITINDALVWVRDSKAHCCPFLDMNCGAITIDALATDLMAACSTCKRFCDNPVATLTTSRVSEVVWATLTTPFTSTQFKYEAQLWLSSLPVLILVLGALAAATYGAVHRRRAPVMTSIDTQGSTPSLEDDLQWYAPVKPCTPSMDP
jgi:hypothetical protein